MAIPKGMRDTYWVGGARYDQNALNKDWQDFGYEAVPAGGARGAGRALRPHHSHTALKWDRMSVPEWIEKYVPGGLTSPFGKLCYCDVISEYGGPPENQSALNLIYILGYNDSTDDGYQSPVASDARGLGRELAYARRQRSAHRRACARCRMARSLSAISSWRWRRTATAASPAPSTIAARRSRSWPIMSC